MVQSFEDTSLSQVVLRILNPEELKEIQILPATCLLSSFLAKGISLQH